LQPCKKKDKVEEYRKAASEIVPCGPPVKNLIYSTALLAAQQGHPF
jgi:hypothetical protein